MCRGAPEFAAYFDGQPKFSSGSMVLYLNASCMKRGGTTSKQYSSNVIVRQNIQISSPADRIVVRSSGICSGLVDRVDVRR